MEISLKSNLAKPGGSMAQITAIERQKRNKSRCSVFVDNEFFCGAAVETVTTLGLKTGQTVDPDQLENLLSQEEELKVRERALRLLDIRNRSRAELERKLLQAGMDPDIIQKVLDRLESTGLVDDQKFAREWIQARQQAGRTGRRRLKWELQQHGVKAETINTLLTDAPPEDESAACETLALAKARNYQRLEPRIARRRLQAFLSRRGFAGDCVIRIVNKLFPASEQD